LPSSMRPGRARVAEVQMHLDLLARPQELLAHVHGIRAWGLCKLAKRFQVATYTFKSVSKD
jgi:hypothetical protein